MEIVVNGEARRLAQHTSVAQLLAEIGLPAQRLAVEVNRTIVPRSRYTAHYLKQGDQVELVRAVGGG
jgi:thiamine biosynthesis protein ThiS